MGPAASWMTRSRASAGSAAKQTSSLLPCLPSLPPLLLVAGGDCSASLEPPAELLLQRRRVRTEVLKAAGQKRWLVGL
jgi:hypothetical protein